MIKLIIISAIFYTGYAIGTNGVDGFMETVENLLYTIENAFTWFEEIAEEMGNA